MGTYIKENYDIYQGSYRNTTNIIKNTKQVIQLPEPKKHRGSGGYYLSAIGSSGSRLGHIADNIFSFGVLKSLFILLFVANFVRWVVDDPNMLTLGTMLRQLSEIKTIPTDWISALSGRIRTKLIGSSDNVAAMNWAQAVVALLLPLPTILYLLIGVLNILWWLMSVLSIFFGTYFF